MSKLDLIKKTINETALLNRYLKSRGINPEFVSKDQKVAHSKTNQFKVWMQAHVNDPLREGMSQEHTPVQKRLHALKKAMHYQKEIRVADGHKKLHSEAVDKKDTITFDIPLLIRVLEFAREDLKSDIDLHKMVERLLNIRGKGTLTMNQYKQIVKEEYQDLNVELIDEISKELANRYMHSAISDRKKDDEKISKSLEKNRKEFSMRRHGNISKLMKKTDKRTTGILRATDRLQKEESLDEVSSEMLDRYKEKAKQSADELHAQGQYGKAVKRYTGVMKATGKQIEKTTAKIKKALKRESLEPMAACNQPGDGANTPDDVAPRSKSYKMVKSVVKKVNEELYDHEKEDKSTAPLGKKPKLQTPGVDAVTKEAPQAAAVLTGGKTLTGEPRDTIEIDPMMKMRKQSPEAQKSV